MLRIKLTEMYLTRGDTAHIDISARYAGKDKYHSFSENDTCVFYVTNDERDVLLQKDCYRVEVSDNPLQYYMRLDILPEDTQSLPAGKYNFKVVVNIEGLVNERSTIIKGFFFLMDDLSKMESDVPEFTPVKSNDIQSPMYDNNIIGELNIADLTLIVQQP